MVLWSRPSRPCAGGEPAELAAEQDQRFVEQAALLQVGEQGGRGLVRGLRVTDQALMQVVVLIPTGMTDLDESDAGLAEPTGHQALPGGKLPSGPGLTP